MPVLNTYSNLTVADATDEILLWDSSAGAVVNILAGDLFGSPQPIGSTTPSTGAFTDLSATGTLQVQNATSAIRFGAAGGLAIGSYGGGKRLYIQGTGSATFQLHDVPYALRFGTDVAIGWTATADSMSTVDTFLLRDAANTLAMRNGVNAQTLRLYNTYTDAANYERGFLGYDPSAPNILFLRHEAAGSGNANRIVVVRSGSTGEVRLDNGANIGWKVVAGHLQAIVDNAYDIGSSGGVRPRDIYAAGTVRGATALRSNKLMADSGLNIVLIGSNNTDLGLCQLGGTTSAFPALKRTNSDIEIVKADGTAANTALILSSPSGNRYRITVSDAGALTTTAA